MAPSLKIVDPAGSKGIPLPTEVLGTTGLRRSGGFIDEEFLATLRGARGARYFNQMAKNNSILGAILYVIEALVRGVKWRVEPSGTGAGATQAKELLETCITDMSTSWRDLMSEVFSMVVYGWSYFEIVYKLRKGPGDDPTRRSRYNDGKIGWRKIDVRAQDTLWEWQFDDEDSGLRGMWQMDPYVARRQVFLPIEKSLLFRTKSSKRNPEGVSLLRPAVRDYHFLTRLQEIEAIGIERDLTGMPIFEVPPELLSPNATPEQKAVRRLLETFVQQVRNDERGGGLVPSEYDSDGKKTGYLFKLMTSGGSRQVQSDTPIRRYESRIAMTFLAEFLMIGTEKVGTETLYQGKTNLFGLALGALLDGVAEVFNLYAVPRLMDLNGVPIEAQPQLAHSDVAAPDLKALGSFIASISAAGIVSPNRALEARVLEIANLPPPDDSDLEIIEDLDTPTPGSPENMATGLLTKDQLDMILATSSAIAAGKIAPKAAALALAAALGLSPEAAAAYLEQPEKKEPAVAPPIPPGAGSAPPAPGDDGSPEE